MPTVPLYSLDKLCPMDVNETDAGKITSFRQLRFTLTRCFTSLEVFIGQRLIVNLPKPEACESEDLVQAFSACCELRDCISLAFLLHQILLAQEEANKAEMLRLSLARAIGHSGSAQVNKFSNASASESDGRAIMTLPSKTGDEISTEYDPHAGDQIINPPERSHHL
ncbi:unnamed protein product [Schistocephalus solidus]|uniref:Uncharacterized protein n=1 Tax=Schistocephalus solidus TaxID=70667 RepID=A0A183SE37_SCHSO|nr:unnamed protein product [Schistocephalus solidus]